MAVCIPLTLICNITQDLLCVLNDTTLPSMQPHLHNFLLLYLIMAHSVSIEVIIAWLLLV